jgi:hypothetical protein
MSVDGVGLAEAIDVVRRELRRAQDAANPGDVRFGVDTVELELTVEIVKTKGAEASVKVLNVLSLGGQGEASRGEVNRVKVVLTPLRDDGRSFEVASAGDRRPDMTNGS